MLILTYIINIIAYIVLFIFSYNALITLFSLKIKKEFTYDIKNTNTFTVLIPCHNEEDVIESTLEALNKVSYPKYLYSVYIIADNCSDNTVKVCNKYLAKNPSLNAYILEVKGGSKPKALNRAISIIKKHGKWTSDNIVIIDADNKVSPSIFNSFNKEHLKGFKLVQCAIRSLNDTSFVAMGFTSAFNNMNRGFQYARNRIGLSGSLSGTGFSINRFVWDKVGFINCDTLTEDLEFSVLSILSGYKIKFVFDDYVLNQHLDELKPSLIQRVRWNRGHTQVFLKLSFPLIKAFFRKPSFQLIDSLLFLSNPIRNLLYVLDIFLELIFRHFATVPLWIMLVPLLYWVAFYMVCDNWKFKYFFPHIFFTITMFFATAYGALTYRNKTWAKTIHKNLDKTIHNDMHNENTHNDSIVA